MASKESKAAYIAGPRISQEYLDAGVWLMDMNCTPMNMFALGNDNDMSWERDVRLQAVRHCDILFLLDGWKDCLDAVDEYEEAILYNRKNGRQIEISYPELRG